MLAVLWLCAACAVVVVGCVRWLRAGCELAASWLCAVCCQLAVPWQRQRAAGCQRCQGLAAADAALQPEHAGGGAAAGGAAVAGQQRLADGQVALASTNVADVNTRMLVRGWRCAAVRVWL